MDMDLASFDNKTIRLVDKWGDVFDGESEWLCPEYCEHEYGPFEEALKIDDFLFFADTIRSVEELSGTPELWMSRRMHHMHLTQKAFDQMDRGRKTLELRLWDEKRRQIRVGDVIRFENVEDETDVLHMDVTELLRFPSFEELYRSVSLADCGYAAGETASPKDMDAFYTPEEQARWGVVAIRVAEPT